MQRRMVRNSVSVLVITFMVGSLFALPILNNDSVNAATMKLNKKKVTLIVGKSYNLKIKNKGKKKVKWASSKKSVVTVTKSGKLKAKKKGKATVTAKVGKKKFKCKITVKNPAKGTKSNPKSATEGVTVTNAKGKMYFKAIIYKNEEAVAKLKATNDWNSYDQTVHELYYPNRDFVVFYYDVKAVSGFKNNDKLYGTDIINPFRLYNAKGTNPITCIPKYGDNAGEYLGNTYFALNGGQSVKMVQGFYVTKGTTAITAPIYQKDYSLYWIIYKF